VIDLGDVRVADGEAEIGWPFSFIVTVKKGEPNERWVFHTANQAEYAAHSRRLSLNSVIHLRN